MQREHPGGAVQRADVVGQHDEHLGVAEHDRELAGLGQRTLPLVQLCRGRERVAAEHADATGEPAPR